MDFTCQHLDDNANGIVNQVLASESVDRFSKVGVSVAVFHTR